MIVKSGSVWNGLFVTVDATGALATPSVGPTGKLYVDGVANAATVTITGSNPYKFSVTLPSLTAGQHVDMYITATISSIATAGIVASAQADTVLLSDGVMLADDAITAASLKADAVTEIQNGLATAAALSAVDDFVDELETRLSAARAGYLDKLNVTGTLANTDNANTFKADISGLATAAALQTVDDLVDDLESRLTATRAGYLDRLDATVSSRLADADYTDPDNAGITAIKAKTDNLPATPANEATLTAISALVDDLESRLTAVRAGYLDKLNVTGTLANTDNASLFSDDLLNSIIEDTISLKESLRLMLAVLAGRSDGGGTGTIKFKDLGGTFDRITATVDVVGNRTNVVLDGSDTGV